jgi:hypothetical protein
MAWTDDLMATRDALVAQRLAVIKAGSKPSYKVHGHEYDWTAYLRYLDEAITTVNKQIAQSEPFEFVSRARV